MIDSDKALALLEEAVKERGSAYVYPKYEFGGACQYVYNGQAACMVGLALVKGGAFELDPDDAHLPSAIFNNEQADNLATYLDITPKAALIFNAAQQEQDIGNTWGDALYAARTFADDFRSYSEDWDGGDE